jgi:hypothetical protein
MTVQELIERLQENDIDTNANIVLRVGYSKGDITDIITENSDGYSLEGFIILDSN